MGVVGKGPDRQRALFGGAARLSPVHALMAGAMRFSAKVEHLVG